ncbi:hypothetical protein ACFFIX_23615 [Metabacillus herbersteinensis]|uniref:3-methyladenine DNA glycosylase n=1 Tax=Metabacillus herbersteinensis TaxID=283816 RepID=A0ABV6GKY2_9BACI
MDRNKEKLSYESDGKMGKDKKEEREVNQEKQEKSFFNTTQTSE